MSDLLNIGISGLSVSKKALETTGHNLSNANTEGYSRQKVDQKASPSIIKDGFIQGSGVTIHGINRVNDSFLENRLNSNISKHKYFAERSLQLEQVENIFNEIDQEGLNKVLNNFFNSFRELANQPENETIRSVVRDQANMVVKDFRRIRETLDELARNTDKKLEQDVVGINQIIGTIGKLNKNITGTEAANGEACDLRDQRDQAVRALSEYFDVTCYSDDRGQYIVSAKNVGTLVTGGETQELMIGRRSEELSSNGMAGSIEMFFKGKLKNAITNNITGGTVASTVKVRNVDIQNLQNRIDEIAFDFANSVNAVHRRGFVNRNISIKNDGDPNTTDTKGPTTGINFFKIADEKHRSATMLDLSDDVKSDLSNIVTALNPNRPGDNRIALAISKIQHERIYAEGTVTLEQKFLQSIGNIGIESGKARVDSEQTEGILVQTRALKERVSGVSLDEETANLVRYQHAYDASAHVMKSADDMFKTVIGLIRN